MKKFFPVLVSVLLVYFSFVSFAYDDNWEWTKDYFNVEDELIEDISDESNFSFSVPSFGDEKDVSEKFSEVMRSGEKSASRSLSSQNFEHNPTDIPFYKMESSFPEQFKLIKDIVNGVNREYTFLISITNNTASIFICQWGVPFIYVDGSATNRVQRVAYGAMFHRGADPYVPPVYHLLRYSFSNDTFSSFLVNESQNSVFGWNFNNTTLNSGGGVKCFSIFSNTRTNFRDTTRDLYYFGFPHIYEEVYLNGSEQLQTEFYPISGNNQKLYVTSMLASPMLGDYFHNIPDRTLIFDSQSNTSPYLCSTNFSPSDFQFNEPASTYEDDSEFNQSLADIIEAFADQTEDYIDYINLSKERVTGYISTFFDNINDLIPRPLYFVFLFLVIISVVIGVFI